MLKISHTLTLQLPSFEGVNYVDEIKCRRPHHNGRNLIIQSYLVIVMGKDDFFFAS